MNLAVKFTRFDGLKIGKMMADIETVKVQLKLNRVYNKAVIV